MQKATSGKEVAFIYTGKFIKTVRKFIKSIQYFENHFSFALKWFSFLTQKLMKGLLRIANRKFTNTLAITNG